MRYVELRLNRFRQEEAGLEFCEFAKALQGILGIESNPGKYTRELFRLSVDENDQEAHDFLSNRGDPTFKAYFSGDRKLTRFAGEFYRFFKKDLFTAKIAECSYEQQKAILDAFKGSVPNMTEGNVPEKTAELFESILLVFIKPKTKSKGKKQKAIVNQAHDTPVVLDDFQLLHECNSKCALCRKRVIKKVNGVAMKRYIVTNIYPDGLDFLQMADYAKIAPAPTNPDSLDNKIILCRDCGDEYLMAPNADTYRQLLAIKTQFVKDTAVTDVTDSVDVEKGIIEILDALGNNKQRPTPDKKSSYDVWRVDSKIPEHNFSLQDRVTQWVLSYYRKIEELFKERERIGNLRFQKVKSEISLCFNNLDEQGINQDEIFERMISWLSEKTRCRNRYALEAFISFFVQNCEVFYEIAE